MNIVRCNDCEWIGTEDELRKKECCPICGKLDYIMDITGYEEYFSDNQIRVLWSIFGDIPMNPDTEEIEECFLFFKPYTHREEIWHWFDQQYSGGIYCLMYGDKK